MLVDDRDRSQGAKMGVSRHGGTQKWWLLWIVRKGWLKVIPPFNGNPQMVNLAHQLLYVIVLGSWTSHLFVDPVLITWNPKVSQGSEYSDVRGVPARFTNAVSLFYLISMGISRSYLNAGTVPYEAIRCGDIPLHSPYIGLIGYVPYLQFRF